MLLRRHAGHKGLENSEFIIFLFSLRHELCGNCNGGCSSLCLPIGRSKRCACSEGVSLKGDDLTCQYAVDVCSEESFTSVTGLETLEECCPRAPGAVCQPKCKSGYDNSSSSAVQCKGGKWNVTLEDICKVAECPASNVIYIGICSGVVVLAIIVVFGICAFRRRSKREQNEPHTYESHGDMVGYATCNEVLSEDLPPTVPDPDIYDHLDEKNFIDASKLCVAIREEVTKKPTDRRNSTSSDRYGKFPGDNHGYVSTEFIESMNRDPQTDYINANDYLQPSSIDDGGSINRAFAYDHLYNNRDVGKGDGYVSSRDDSDGQVCIGRDMTSARYSQHSD